jgi:hypothetical protein
VQQWAIGGIAGILQLFYGGRWVSGCAEELVGSTVTNMRLRAACGLTAAFLGFSVVSLGSTKRLLVVHCVYAANSKAKLRTIHLVDSLPLLVKIRIVLRLAELNCKTEFSRTQFLEVTFEYFTFGHSVDRYRRTQAIRAVVTSILSNIHPLNAPKERSK